MIEGRADPSSPNPHERPLPKRPWRWCVLGATALSIVGPLSLPVAQSLAPSDDQERFIEDGVRAVMDTSDVNVACVPDAQMHVLGNEGMGLPYTGHVWVSQRGCDGVTLAAAEPLTVADLAQPQLTATTEFKIRGLRTLAHELGHSVGDTHNEPAAECIALQIAPDLATAFGMHPALEPELQERLLALMVTDQTGGEAWESYVFDPQTCRPGGSGDLSDEGIGTQVYFPAGQ